MSRVAELLNLVTFFSANPGIPIEKAATATSRSVKQLLHDLNEILMVGLPPYDPGSYINFGLHGSAQEVRLQLSDHFARPLAFTATEAVALRAALEHFAPSADAETAKLIDDLRRTLAEALRGRAREALTGGSPGFVTPKRTDRIRELTAELTRACTDGCIIEIEYYSAHRALLAQRRVHPFEIIDVGTHAYLYAHCELAEATRHFRIDRIRNIKTLQGTRTRKPPKNRDAGRMASLFEGKPKDTLKIRFSKEVAADVADEWKGSPDARISTDSKGGLTLSAPLFNQFWAMGYIISFGRHAELIEPRWLRVELAETIRKSLKAHE